MTTATPETERLVEWASRRTCEPCGPDCRMLAQCAWTPEQIAEYLETPIPYELDTAETDTLVLGLHAPHTRWTWKPYEKRSEEHRADYDRLLVSIYHEGIKTPVIVWENFVLIGQRRIEIAKRLRIPLVPVLRITEDVRLYWKHDVERINRHLKAAAGAWKY